MRNMQRLSGVELWCQMSDVVKISTSHLKLSSLQRSCSRIGGIVKNFTPASDGPLATEPDEPTARRDGPLTLFLAFFRFVHICSSAVQRIWVPETRILQFAP